MIVHLASFVWKDGTSPEQVAGVTAALYEMAREVPQLRFYLCGENLRLRPAGADFGVLALVDDPAGLDAYLDGEAHQRVQREWLSTMVASRQAAQLSSDALSVTGDWLAGH
ncbi:Dabb family protein [Lysinimonas soli]|uniref:Dabb family protein n=1 Tax=Lysinimonas soli TaxID=1074233 RepID=A0ABW0NV06_9MICO